MAIFTGLLIFCVIGIGYSILYTFGGDDKKEKTTVTCTAVVVVLIGAFFPILMIATETNDEIEYITNYETQKEVIEESLQNDNLLGYERAALVNKAAELNGELAERKLVFNRWYNCYLNNTLYDNVTPINLDVSKDVE